MITKKLLHDIVTFCNNYIDNKNIIFIISKYPTLISIEIDVWPLTNNEIIDDEKGKSYSVYIHNEKEFIQYKQKVLKILPKLLEKLKEK